MSKPKKEKLTKTTVMLPESLLKEAQQVSGLGITPTLRMALELLSAKKRFSELLALKGTYKSKLNLKDLRED